MDPLSDVLSLLKPRSYVHASLDAGREWSIRFPKYDGLKCNAVVSGQCWLRVEGVAQDVLLETGDCFLLPSGRPFVISSDVGLAPVDAHTVFSNVGADGVVTHQGGGTCFIIGSRFDFDGDYAGLLLSVLPPIVHLRTQADQAAMRWLVERLMEELRERQPGSSLIAQHLAQMMLVQALRLHLEGMASGGVGWLFALADKRLAVAIALMHGNPAHRWTVRELADRVGMSRSVFSMKFKEAVGTSPLEYLTRWRMLLSADRLTKSRDPVSVIALSLGYESESAFSTAFKRTMGCSPRRYARNQELGLAAG